MLMVMANTKSFFRYCACRKNLNPPYPPFSKGGNCADSFASPPLKKGDLGGFKNQQTERMFGKGYKTPLNKLPTFRLGLIILWLLAWTGAGLAADSGTLPAKDWNLRQVGAPPGSRRGYADLCGPGRQPQQLGGLWSGAPANGPRSRPGLRH